MLTAHWVPGSMEAHYTWDRHAPDGRMVGQPKPGGLARSYTYHVDHTLVTDSEGREGRYHFVGSGPGRRWTAHTRADGSQIEFRYDRAGIKVATVDPLGHETLIERDDHGQVLAQTGPDGTRWAIERDALGQPVSIEGPDDQRWQITRNERGHPLEVSGPGGQSILMIYGLLAPACGVSTTPSKAKYSAPTSPMPWTHPCNGSPQWLPPLVIRTRRLGSSEKPARRAQRYPTHPVPGAVAR